MAGTGTGPGAPGQRLSAGACDRPAVELAPLLIGARLVVGDCEGVIVETEAYGPEDPASHSFPGPTRRNASMFGPPGRAYVYRSYGLHWCLNLVAARGHAVLLRALWPTAGLATMAARRGTDQVRRLASGPGRLAQALGITGDDDGRPFDAPGFGLWLAPPPGPLARGPRIGLRRAADWPHRFGLAGSCWLSRPFPRHSDDDLDSRRVHGHDTG